MTEQTEHELHHLLADFAGEWFRALRNDDFLRRVPEPVMNAWDDIMKYMADLKRSGVDLPLIPL